MTMITKHSVYLCNRRRRWIAKTPNNLYIFPKISKNTKQSLHLLEEIIEEILSRLAVKSLLKFRCVSKSWHSLIGSERFIKKHHQNSTRNTTLAHHRVLLSTPYKVELSQCPLVSLLDKHDIPALKCDFATDIFLDSITLVGCCNGLVCILLNHNMLFCGTHLPESRGNCLRRLVTSIGFMDSATMSRVVITRLLLVLMMNHLCVKPAEQWGILASGKLHWEIMSVGIVSFDLKEEVFEIVEESFEEEVSYCVITTLAQFGTDQLSLMNVHCLLIDVVPESTACGGLHLIKFSTYDYCICLRGWEFTEAAYYNCGIYVESLVSPI